MITVLLSTSSLWNCGDDFIREGLLELLQFKPDVRIVWWNRGYGIANGYANDLDVNLPLMDYFIVAGTPQWIYKNERIYRHCLKRQIPLSIIGVGMRNIVSKSHYRLMKQVAKSGLCEVAFARDKVAFVTLKELGFSNVHLTPDPAFFMPSLNGEKKVNILGWRDQFNYDYDPTLLYRHPLRLAKTQLIKWLKREDRAKMRRKYNNLMLQVFSKMARPKTVIVHDNREINEAENLFGAEYVFYSTDYREIFKKYSVAKNYVGSRLHGAISSIIHGASVHLIYTNKKAEAIENSINILYAYIKSIRRSIKVSYFGEERIYPKECGVAINKESLKVAISKEKEKTRYILKKQPILKNYIS